MNQTNNLTRTGSPRPPAEIRFGTAAKMSAEDLLSHPLRSASLSDLSSQVSGESLPDTPLDSLLEEALDSFYSASRDVKLPTHPLQSHLQSHASALQGFRETLDHLRALLPERSVSPPQERVNNINPRKADVARQLATWMQETLSEERSVVAIVARQGGLQHLKHDKTGMLHTGIVLRHPQDNCWKIYNLIDRPEGRGTRCEVQWTEPVDFFAQQGGYQKQALLLFPDHVLQCRLREGLLNGQYKRLGFTSAYNLVSPPHGPDSLNCNKWTLLNLLAAQQQNYEPTTLLRHIKQQYQPGQIEVHPLVRLFSRYQPRIKANEVPWWGPIQTVTVQSLYNSGLFEKTRFCAARGLERVSNAQRQGARKED